MWSYIFEYLNSSSNYSIENTSNLFNCLYQILLLVDKDKQKEIIEIMKIQIGLKFVDQFKQYIFRKIPNSEILKNFN